MGTKEGFDRKLLGRKRYVIERMENYIAGVLRETQIVWYEEEERINTLRWKWNVYKMTLGEQDMN